MSNIGPVVSYLLLMGGSHDMGNLEGKILDGRYRLDRIIGEGGMGTVYRAEQLALQVPVAVKILDPDYGADIVHFRRFVREARVTAQVDHPNVARVLDLGRTSDAIAFTVMEYLEGEDLCEVLARSGPLPWARVQRIMLQAIAGLSAAHDIGVIHRDIKPSNLFSVTSGPGAETIKLLDFGIAKSNDPSSSFARNLTLMDTIVGTPEYMAPERIRGEVADVRTDVYSLGVVMFELLTGQMPWDRDVVGLRWLLRRMQEPTPRLPAIPGLPHEVTALVARAMARDPAERFSCLRELGAALEAVPASGARWSAGAPGRTRTSPTSVRPRAIPTTWVAMPTPRDPAALHAC